MSSACIVAIRCESGIVSFSSTLSASRIRRMNCDRCSSVRVVASLITRFVRDAGAEVVTRRG